MTARPKGQPAPATGRVRDYSVELPSGGRLHLQTPDEVELWETALRRFREDYVFMKHNDLVSLGSLLQQQIIVFRCQVAINGMEPELDGHGVPTGSYRRVELDGGDTHAFQKTLTEAQREMGRLEKQLGIDKATREAGGAHTVENYLRTLKRAAHERAIHITKRTLRYEEFVMQLRWRVHLLYQGDKEDRAYHDVTPRTVLEWVRAQLAELEAIDKKFAHEKGKLYVGKL